MKRFVRCIKCAALALAALFQTQAQAQNVTGTGYIDMQLDPNAPLIQPGAGNRFIWRDQLFFVGKAEANQNFSNDSVSILGSAGSESVAIMGNAWWNFGTAVGCGSSARDAVAIGRFANASGGGSIAIGTADDNNNGWASARQTAAIAIGYSVESSGESAITIGTHSLTSKAGSVNIGGWNQVTGSGSVAIGCSIYTSADNSFAIGSNVTANAVGSIALGRSNKSDRRKDNTLVDSATPHPSDPLLTVGNGDNSTRSNAFTIYRDGTVRLSKASGGISMGQFN